ncbi:MAG: hypothetical protein IIW07_01985 [Clostridia bacterium]|nr:hypothetical protein [Clostridia bacterium]
MIGHFNENLREWPAIRHDLRNSAEGNPMEGANTGSEPLMAHQKKAIREKRMAFFSEIRLRRVKYGFAI